MLSNILGVLVLVGFLYFLYVMVYVPSNPNKGVGKNNGGGGGKPDDRTPPSKE